MLTTENERGHSQAQPRVADLLSAHAVPFPELHRRYGPLLEMVRTLLGVVPNCDPYLEIWPPAFRTYNVMVPNLINLPWLLWGFGAPRSTIGLAMYAASRASSCMYCSAHTCTFALRRGADVDAVASAMDDASPALSDADRAAVRIARQLSVVPAAVTEEARADLYRHFSAADAEWIVLSVAMMGWLNKTMDALGIPLEEDTIAEVSPVISRSGWEIGQHMPERALRPEAPPPAADSLLKRLALIRHAPPAIKLDKEWTRGVPDTWPAVGEYLREKTGYRFPILSKLRHRSALRGIATMIRLNFGSGDQSVIGKEEKLAAGLIYAECVGNVGLADEMREMGAEAHLSAESPVQRLARAISPSPARVDESAMEAARNLSAAGIVELVSFVAVMQLWQRVSRFV